MAPVVVRVALDLMRAPGGIGTRTSVRRVEADLWHRQFSESLVRQRGLVKRGSIRPEDGRVQSGGGESRGLRKVLVCSK